MYEEKPTPSPADTSVETINSYIEMKGELSGYDDLDAETVREMTKILSTPLTEEQIQDIVERTNRQSLNLNYNPDRKLASELLFETLVGIKPFEMGKEFGLTGPPKGTKAEG